MKVVICGSRRCADPFGLSLAINARVGELPSDCLVITGGARGADQMAHLAATLRGLPTLVIAADWDRFGKRAGALRNLAMLNEKPDKVIAYWDGKSPGTRHTVEKARARGIPCEVIACS